MHSEKTTLLVLVGCHGSGKSTLGRRSAELLGWRFDEEIGETLRLERLALDPGAHAARPQQDFDREVFQRELARDQERTAECRVVETWHPGNLAYALKRSPRVALEAWNEIKQRSKLPGVRVLVQPLALSAAALHTRLREPGPDAEHFVPWLLEVGTCAREIAEWLELEVAPTLMTDELTVDNALKILLNRIHQFDHPT